MSMYVEVLSGALSGWVEDVSEEDLVDHVLACLVALPPEGERTGRSANARLAAEIAYDRALIKLAEENGVDVATVRFSNPQVERRRLETELARKGLDLRGMAAIRRKT